jgi:hypothetical protein
MAIVANIVINDEVPTARTYVAANRTAKEIVFLERSAVAPALDNRIILSYDFAKASRPTDRPAVRFDFPTTQVVDGQTVVRSTEHFYLNAVIPQDMTTAERTARYTMFKNWVASASGIAYLSGRDPVV